MFYRIYLLYRDNTVSLCGTHTVWGGGHYVAYVDRALAHEGITGATRGAPVRALWGPHGTPKGLPWGTHEGPPGGTYGGPIIPPQLRGSDIRDVCVHLVETSDSKISAQPPPPTPTARPPLGLCVPHRETVLSL